MAQFEPKQHSASDFNGGQKYINGEGTVTGDILDADMPNNVIESQLWTQALAENPVDNREADNVGTAVVTIELMPDGTPRFKVSNIKGKQGIGIVSISPNGVDENGGNKYIVTLSDETTYNITAPKGAKGDTGNGIASSVISYATNSNSNVMPQFLIWQPTMPTVPKGWYLWTRTVFTDTNGDTSTVYSIAYQGLDGTNAVESVNGQTGVVEITSVENADNATHATSADSAETATTASKLGSTTIGSSTKPIYLSGGTPTACSRTIPSITLNGSSTTAPSIYAPTSAGSTGELAGVIGGVYKYMGASNYQSGTQTNTENSVDYVYMYYRSSDGSTWYRIWRSGWKECGGFKKKNATLASSTAWDADIVFSTTFNSNTYTAVATASYGTNTNTVAGQEVVVLNKTTMGMSIHLYNRNSSTAIPNTIQLEYYCCGY